MIATGRPFAAEQRSQCGRAAFAMRAQRTLSELARERRIRLHEAERDDLVEQRHRPQMRILKQTLAAIVRVRVEP